MQRPPEGMYWAPSTGAEATGRDVLGPLNWCRSHRKGCIGSPQSKRKREREREFIYSINKVEADADVNKNNNNNNAIKVILNYLKLFGGCGTRGLYEQLFYNIFN